VRALQRGLPRSLPTMTLHATEPAQIMAIKPFCHEHRIVFKWLCYCAQQLQTCDEV
jgi:hypothetical protein